MSVRQALQLSGCGMAVLLLAGCAGGSNDGLFEFVRTEQEVSTAAPMERGKTLFGTRQYGLALEAFRDALAEDPGSTQALNAVAATFDQLGRFDLAEKYYQRALQIAPDSVETLNNLGYSHVMRGEADQARKYLALAAQLDGKNPVVRANLAMAEQSAGAAPLPADETNAPVAAPAVPQLAVINASLAMESGSALGFGHAAPMLVSAPRVQLVRASRGVQNLITLGVTTDAAPVSFAAIGPVMPVATALGTETPPPAVPLIPVSLAGEQPLFFEVANGTGRLAMAARLREYLAAKGVTVAGLSDDDVFGHGESLLSYRAGSAKRAAEIARLLPVPVRMVQAGEDQAADIRLLLGADMLPFDDELVEAM